VAEVAYTEVADIAAPPERVFDFRLDFAHLPEYNPNVSNVRRVEGGARPGVGTEYLFDLTLAGMGTLETPLRIAEVERPARVVFDTGPGFIAREVCTFSPAGGGTRAEFTVTLTIPGEIDDATRASLEAQGREQVRLELDLMKKILEG
jgi:uncharacterized protein YndB with AHSA1/START domain